MNDKNATGDKKNQEGSKPIENEAELDDAGEEDEDGETVVMAADEDEEIDRFRGREERAAPEKVERREVEPRKRKFESAADIFSGEIQARAANANPRLRALLQGLIQVSIKGSDTAYHLDWRGEQPKSGGGGVEGADCTIVLGEKDLLKIAAGDLNPQIAMLSDKVKVEGRPELAVYFFNLISFQSGR